MSDTAAHITENIYCSHRERDMETLFPSCLETGGSSLVLPCFRSQQMKGITDF